MKTEVTNKFHSRKLSGLILSAAVIIFSGCGAYWSTNPEGSPTGQNIDNRPAAPVVVDGVRTSYADVVNKTAPAVVQITALNTTGRTRRVDGENPFEDFFNQNPEPREQQPRRGFGSGVLVSADGTILTNHHVIDEADKITVEMSDNRTFEAKIVGSDPPSDLAVLKIETKDLPFLKLGDSDSVRVGDIVLAIGNPLGIGQSVTSGIISAKGRRTGLGDGTSFQDFLQTDAPINQGNSGGALVNVNGELIGINSQILSSSAGGGSIGIGFAIPSNMAKVVMEQLLETGKVRRGMLGVNIQDVSSEMAKTLELGDASGVIVSNVREGSAAAKAGVKRGDIITKINGEAVEDGNFLRNKVASTKPGSEITLTVVRDKQEQEIKVTLDEYEIEGEKPSADKPQTPGGKSEQNGKLGLSLQPLTPEIRGSLNIPSDVKGVIVTEVDPGSPAQETGIEKGDVILEINRQAVETLDDVRSALAKSGTRSALLLISRGGRTLYVTVRPNE
jgi:serine protease Do